MPYQHAKKRLIAYVISGLLVISLGSPLPAQQEQLQPLSVESQSLPRAFIRTPYQVQLQARGGVPPYKWEITEGSLPTGIVLQGDGQLIGMPQQSGDFHFTATVRDSGRPAHEIKHSFLLTAASPLMAQWGHYPKVNGQRLEGSILVSNETERDFDLTVIVLAVNEIGRATAIGYQHFNLKKDTEGMEIPFGDNLSSGSYQLNVDAVAEVPEIHSIYRTRLVPKERFLIQQGP
jgi:hypothetical protein